MACAAAVEVEGPGEGVGGTTVGVAGCSATRAIPRDDVAGDAMLLFAGLLSTPSELTSMPSLKTKVPSWRRACSKSRSVRETLR